MSNSLQKWNVLPGVSRSLWGTKRFSNRRIWHCWHSLQHRDSVSVSIAEQCSQRHHQFTPAQASHSLWQAGLVIFRHFRTSSLYYGLFRQPRTPSCVSAWKVLSAIIIFGFFHGFTVLKKDGRLQFTVWNVWGFFVLFFMGRYKKLQN